MLNKCLINAFVIKLILMTANINAETVFIFNHGLGGNKNQIKFYQMPNKANWDILGQRTVSFDFPEVSGDGNINMNNANLAQDKDIEALDIVYKECLKDKNVDKIILVGVSRGASVAIAYASRHPEKLAGMVLESPFDSIDKIIKYQLNQKYIGWIPGLRFIAHSWIANVYKAYDKNGIQPIDVVKSLPKDLPILFVHSKQDKLISVKSS
ncbi:MAG: alpha/beta fold hydrolase, partial [Novosphingobium sp.]|nr:alpha/beta fold hydrolase [Novosphingobium sp.]